MLLLVISSFSSKRKRMEKKIHAFIWEGAHPEMGRNLGKQEDSLWYYVRPMPYGKEIWQVPKLPLKKEVDAPLQSTD